MTFTQRRAGVATPIRLRGRNGSGTVRPKVRTPDPPPVTPSGDTVYAAEPLGAGGWVTGMSISPDGLTRLARTDTMGAWRWSTTTDRWEAAITGTTMADDSKALDSGEGVNAVAAANARSFIAYRSRVYRSTDRGLTWAKVLDGPTTAPNMGAQRWWNTRMAFDPADANTLIYGTLRNGLYFTRDGGTTWTQVSSSLLPVGLDGATTPGKATYGIPCVAIDGSGNWYAAPFGSGVYLSSDHGTSWTKISSDSQFVAVAGMQAGPNGDLMVAAHTSSSTLDGTTSVLYRYRSGTWAAMNPVGGGVRIWRTVAYDPSTPGRVIVQGDGGYNRVSTDYGTTWNSASHSMESAADVPWLAAANGFGADFYFVTIGGLQYDPVVAGRLWMSQGIGVWYADTPSSPTGLIPWHAQSRGIEQLVVNDVLCPPGGAPVVTSWDRAIFLAGESQSAPVVQLTAPTTSPVGYPASLAGVLIAAYPTAGITYAWTVVSKPGSSTGGSFANAAALATSFTPDVAGTYTLRLTVTNSIGATTKDATITASGTLTGLVLPGATGNYLSTPDTTDLNIAGDLTLIAKLSLADWAPATRTAIIGKHGIASRSYRMAVDNQGIYISLETAASGATGFHGSTGIPLAFAGGSVHWIRLVYSATAQTVVTHTSDDGTTWTLHKSQSTSFGGALGPLATSTAPLTVGWAGSVTPYAAGNIYKAQVYSGATKVADFDAEPVTRTATRTPATVTDSVGRVWTPTGTGWDWI